MAKALVTRGRPKDAEVTQAAILDAAEAAFAERGFAGARIDAIAEASGYNKSLIFHYFGDKLGLYTAVLRRADEQGRYLQSYLLELLDRDTPVTPETFRRVVEQLVRASFDYYLAHPRLLRILAWEEAAGWATLAKIASRFDQNDFEQFAAALERARRAGVLRPHVSLSFISYVIANACRSYLTSRPLFQLIAPDSGELADGDSDAAREQIVAFVVHGLIADPAGDALPGQPK